MRWYNSKAMRIPNQLNQDSLYARGRRSVPAMSSWRRVVRLIIVLALVLVVMRQASRTDVYEIFFPAPMTPVSVSRPSQSERMGAVDAQQRPSTRLPNTQPDSSARAVTASSSAVQVDRPGRVLSPGAIAAEDQRKIAAADVVQQQEWLRNWIETGQFDPALQDSFDPAVQVNGRDIPSVEMDASPQVSDGTVLAIQKSLIDRAIDGSVWRAADLPGLAASLELHRKLSAQMPVGPTAAVLPLLQQPEVYRGQSLTAEGELVRVQRIRASENEFAIHQYLNLWMRPLTGVDRPWLVIVPDLPEAMSALLSDDDEIVDVVPPLPEIRISGEYLKRLSYRSELGIELTPVIVGHISAIKSNGHPNIETPPSARANVGDARPTTLTRNGMMDRFWMILLLTGVCGLTFGFWVMRRSERQIRRARDLRHRQTVTLPE
ncbi:MAG: hypothetical protein AAF745_05165 [Planctomycetota bacterium]